MNWRDKIIPTIMAFCIGSSVAFLGVMVKVHLLDEKKPAEKQR